MTARAETIWLGHCRTGGRLLLRSDELHPGINVLGSGADHLAAVIAGACSDAGLTTFVLDFRGETANGLSGRFDVRSLGYFLYDSERMEEKASLHAELAASAYTMALNLSFEQEGFLNSAIQGIADEQGVASPASLYDRLGRTGEFRGHTADELRGKLGALKTLNLTGEIGVVKQMLKENAVASFAEADSHQGAEVAGMLLIAKVLAIGASGGGSPDVLIVNGANRIFANLPLTRHSNRLLTELLSTRFARVFASEETYGLDHHFVETSQVRIISSGIWNELTAGRASVGGLYSPQHAPKKGSAQLSSLILTPNMFVMQDATRGYEEVFVPRLLAPSAYSTTSDAKPQREESRLTKRVLETLAGYDHATRGSVASFLSDDESVAEIERTIDRLQSEGYLEIVGRNTNRDSPLQTFRLTPSGYELLKRLR